MKTILATDGSMPSELAIAVLSKLPTSMRDEVIVTSVIAAPMGPMLGFEPVGAPIMAEEIQVAFEAQLDAGKKLLAEASARLESAGSKVRTELMEGHATENILELSDRENADLIVVGSRGNGGFEEFVLGSVAKELLAKAPCSVLIVRPFLGDQYESAINQFDAKQKLRLAVGVDGSDCSQVALEAIKGLGKGAFDSIGVVCAEPLAVLQTGMDPESLGPNYAGDHDRVHDIVRRTQEELASFAHEIEGGQGLGTASKVVSEFARQRHSDLIAVGATQHGFFERFLIGSVSAELASTAPCSVWVIRPRSR
jgi:nucleotide-binding universal stress UspA family protein